MIHTLTAADLRWSVDLDKLDTELDGDDRARPGALGQDRALRALDVGLGIGERGFNLFVVGAPGTGRTSTLRSELGKRAAQDPVPDDWCLLYNFDDPDRPRSLRMPAGRAIQLRRQLDTFVDRLESTLTRVFETESYHRRREVLATEHEQLSEDALADTDAEAQRRGFLLSRSGGGITLGPLKDGAPLTEEDYAALSQEDKEHLEAESKILEDMLEVAVRVIRELERETEDKFAELDREVADQAVEPLFKDLRDQFGDIEGVPEHLDKLREDLLERIDSFRSSPESGEPEEGAEASLPPAPFEPEDELPIKLRYKANVLVDNSKLKGAPVIEETHPTPFNLLGRVEHRMRGGDTQTDFTRIKPGALHRANGGYLLVDATELLRDGNAWEGLKRALKNRKLEIEDPGESGRMVSVASLRPEPIPLEIKVVIVGTPDVYYLLSRNDPDFRKLFKIKVDFDTEVQRSDANLKGYSRFLCALAREEKLLPLARSGIGRAIEHAARLASRRDKLSTRFGEIADLLREASFYARRRQAQQVEDSDVRAALNARTEREAFLEYRMREEIEQGIVRIDLDGTRVGQVNGLTVLDLGSYSFGQPARVSATVAVGRGDLVDIERETELGGPIHTKGVLILRGLLAHLFGQRRPLRFSASLCIEQSYIPIDGDSASLAETCALLSALGQLGVDQHLAVTGSVDQRGAVQAVGGTNEKIEGFFATCESRGLDGQHGVILPRSNISELMLREDVVAACSEGKFHVHAVSSVEEAIELLCGQPFGQRNDQDRYPEGSVGDRIDRAFESLDHAWRAQRRPSAESTNDP